MGYAFARQLAAEGLNLIPVDVLDDEPSTRAAELRSEFGVDIDVLVMARGGDDRQIRGEGTRLDGLIITV